MLKDPTDKVVCHANVKNAVGSIAKSIDVSAFGHASFKQGVDGRDKPGHDVERLVRVNWRCTRAFPTYTETLDVMPGHPVPAFGRPECKLVPGLHAIYNLAASKAWRAGT